MKYALISPERWQKSKNFSEWTKRAPTDDDGRSVAPGAGLKK